MKSVNNSCGAVAVFFDTKDNSGLFEKNNSYVLKKFDLYGRKCALVSEGSRVTLLSNPGNIQEQELLSVSLPTDMSNRVSSLMLKWYNNSVSLHADICLTGKEISKNE
ncbi:MAG: hypothetical protein JXN63_02440 [Candidatus Delongbacteria bacterium]|nr:hypothetical protein [Candidatus Delongbacteria bacterium]